MSDAIVAGIIGAVAAICGAIAGGLLSGWYQDHREKRDRPRLKLDFDSNVGKVETEWDGSHPFSGIVLKASLRNEGVTSALNCRVFMTALTIIQSSGTTGTNFKDSRQIAWAGWSFEPKAVPREVVFFVDFARVSKHDPGWIFTFDREIVQDQALKGYRGTYRFRLVAVSDNAEPTYLDIDVDYKGDWNSLQAWKPSK